MDITEFKRILASFADEPSDVDIRLGKVVAQIRDEVFDVSINYSTTPEKHLLIVENEETYPARSWLLNRVARLPQLADRIISTTNISDGTASGSPFVMPAGTLSPDLSSSPNGNEDRATDDVVETLFGKANQPLPGATSILYITSDAGEGKTTIINRAARLQAQRFKEKKVTSLILPIPLGGRAFLTFDDAVIASLVNKFRFNYLYYDAFIELVRMGAIIPAFDGYEEMLVEGSKNEAVSALGNLAQTLESSGTVFVAARKAFFEYLSFKTQAKLFDAIGNRSVSFSRLAISRWDKNRFCEYGSLRGVEDQTEIYDTVATRLGADHPLLTRAVLVRRLYDVAAEKTDRSRLAEMLCSSPQDYFYTFVDAIVKREASEKWLSRISAEVMEPLLTTDEHHILLSRIAQEMWESSTTSLRLDVIDVLVDIFSDDLKKNPRDVRQIKERLKQHSLLAADLSRGQAIAFDHEDFQNFYTGEGLGRILLKGARSDLQTFLAVNLLAAATTEQAIQFLIRHDADRDAILVLLQQISGSEPGFSFCKENCGALVILLAESLSSRGTQLSVSSLIFPTDALAGHEISEVTFKNCHFQPTGTYKGSLRNIVFENCEFERIEIDLKEQNLKTCIFRDCRIDSVVLASSDEYTFDPIQIAKWLESVGVDSSKDVNGVNEFVVEADERFKLLERCLRIFIRSTQVDEDIIRLRLGNGFSQKFFDDVLPSLLDNGLFEEVPWKGRGIQRRYKLTRQMSDVSDALERSHGSFDKFFSNISMSRIA